MAFLSDRVTTDIHDSITMQAEIDRQQAEIDRLRREVAALRALIGTAAIRALVKGVA